MEKSASPLIDARTAQLADWRGATLARVRALIRQAAPDIVEKWKWRGVPAWSHDGVIRAAVALNASPGRGRSA